MGNRLDEAVTIVTSKAQVLRIRSREPVDVRLPRLHPLVRRVVEPNLDYEWELVARTESGDHVVVTSGVRR